MSNPTAASEAAYSRLATVRKATVKDYAADFDPDMEYNRLCDAVLVDAADKGSPFEDDVWVMGISSS